MEKSDEKGLKAASRFNQGFNCAQSVFSVFADDFGLDEKDALRIASTFGGGINGMGKTCGAVTGALMAMGLKYGRTTPDDHVASDKTKAMAAGFLDKFRERHGSVDCDFLLEKARKSGAFQDVYRDCPNYVKESVELLAQVMHAKKTD
jgi:C_GCAxxG_C_C family probable redox protein